MEKSVKIKTWAPVVIPTLNRFEHFKRCLESLEKCIGADKTDVYVGLDYPPSEKYVEGWKKIDEYLTEREKSNGFKNLYVRRRDHNCGVMNPHDNGTLLIEEIQKVCDRYILSEDDNEFSANFLDYINQGLEMYKDDDNCISVCGFTHYALNFSDYSKNVFLCREYSAWGVGMWCEKNNKFVNFLNIDYAKSIMSSWKKIWTIYKHEPRLLNTIMLNIAINFAFGDTMRVAYQYLANKYSLFPVKSKVRNWGHDGSGITNFKVNNDYITKQYIDENDSFIMDNIKRDVDCRIQKKIEKRLEKSFVMNLIILIRVFIYRLIKIDILYFEVKRRNRSLFTR